MARISTYGSDANVSGQDKLIGTDSSGGATKNFPISAVADFFNKAGSIGILKQHNVYFQADISEGRASGTISFTAGGGAGTSMSAITTIMVSQFDGQAQDVSALLEHISGGTVMIFKLSNPNTFGEYLVSSFVEDVSETNYYNMALTSVGANGTLEAGEFYGLGFVDDVESSDAHYTHSQGVASATWVVTHNLDKRPSVTVVDSADNVVYGEVEYNSNNQITLTFIGAFSGNAYFN